MWLSRLPALFVERGTFSLVYFFNSFVDNIRWSKMSIYLWIFSSFLLAHTFHASPLLSLSQYFCGINLRSGVVIASTVFFLLRIAFAICVFCVYIWILELSLLVLWRMYLWDCIWICRLITFAYTAIFTHSASLGAWMFFLFCSFFFSFFLWCLKVFTSEIFYLTG